jgi:hypothetical protein
MLRCATYLQTYTIHSGADVSPSAETAVATAGRATMVAVRHLLSEPATASAGTDSGEAASADLTPSYFGDDSATPQGTRARAPQPVQGNPLEGVNWGDTHSQMMAIDQQVQLQQRRHKRHQQPQPVQHKPGVYGAWGPPPS